MYRMALECCAMGACRAKMAPVIVSHGALQPHSKGFGFEGPGDINWRLCSAACMRGGTANCFAALDFDGLQ